MKNELKKFDLNYINNNTKVIAGVDEVGRGCIAGPLVAAAVILPIEYQNHLIKDSKKLNAKQREKLYFDIIQHAIDYKIEIIPANDVDKYNPKQASIIAMNLAINNLKVKPDLVLVDFEKINENYISIKKGDQKSFSIAAASILAKVFRDNLMIELDSKYPKYGFKYHKGYLTKKHFEYINSKKELIEGIYRKTYKPIKGNENNYRWKK